MTEDWLTLMLKCVIVFLSPQDILDYFSLETHMVTWR